MDWKILVFVLFSAIAPAEVVDKSANGFTVRSTATVAATPARVYSDVLEGVGKWWVSSHTWSGDAGNLSIAAKAGGCFCERLPSGGEVQHMTVIYAAPGKLLRMSGVLGPLQQSGASGTLTFELKSNGGETQITLTYSVGGYFQGGIDKLAEPVDQVIGGQLAALKKYLAR